MRGGERSEAFMYLVFDDFYFEGYCELEATSLSLPEFSKRSETKTSAVIARNFGELRNALENR
jgi:hypothetical protein